jgi:hypothetical protein
MSCFGRIRELQEANSAEVIALEISSRNSRIRALQRRWDRLRARLAEILDQRGADMADIPGGSTGLLRREYKGKKADRLVTRIDTRIISLSAELRAHERQAAEELGHWKTGVAAPKPPDAPPATFTLAQLCTPDELAAIERRASAMQRELELRQQRQREGGRRPTSTPSFLPTFGVICGSRSIRGKRCRRFLMLVSECAVNKPKLDR